MTSVRCWLERLTFPMWAKRRDCMENDKFSVVGRSEQSDVKGPGEPADDVVPAKAPDEGTPDPFDLGQPAIVPGLCQQHRGQASPYCRPLSETT